MPPKGILEPVVPVPPPDMVTGIFLEFAYFKCPESSLMSEGNATSVA